MLELDDCSLSSASDGLGAFSPPDDEGEGSGPELELDDCSVVVSPDNEDEASGPELEDSFLSFLWSFFASLAFAFSSCSLSHFLCFLFFASSCASLSSIFFLFASSLAFASLAILCL